MTKDTNRKMKLTKSAVPVAVRNFKEHANLAGFDWRLHAATTVSQDAIHNGRLIEKGSTVKVASILRVSKKTPKINLGAPSITAMLLNVAARNDDEAKTLHDDLVVLVNGSNSPNEDDRRFFDGLEKRMTAVTFTYAALESFANENIEVAYGQNGYRYDQQQKSGLIVPYSLEDVEKRLSLSEKLSTVVPEALKVTTPRGRTVWNQFVRLREVRDRIIHLKGPDRGHSSDNWLFRELISKKSDRFANHAYEMIAYFYDQVPDLAPRWFAKCPLART